MRITITITITGASGHAKAARELGYAPRPIVEGFADTVAWFEQTKQTGVVP